MDELYAQPTPPWTSREEALRIALQQTDVTRVRVWPERERHGAVLRRRVLCQKTTGSP